MFGRRGPEALKKKKESVRVFVSWFVRACVLSWVEILLVYKFKLASVGPKKESSPRAELADTRHLQGEGIIYTYAAPRPGGAGPR